MQISSTNTFIIQILLLLGPSSALEPIERKKIWHHIEYADEKRMCSASVKIIIF